MIKNRILEFDITTMTKPKYKGSALKIFTIRDLKKFHQAYIESGGKIFWKNEH